MPSQFGGIAVEESGSQFGGIPVSDPAMNPGHAPTFSDQANDSAQFLWNEVKGVGSALNPVNIAKGLYNTVAHPIDTATAIAKTPMVINNQMESGDMEGLANSLGNVAGTILGAKAIPEVPNAIKSVGDIGKSQQATALMNAAAPAAMKELPLVKSGYSAYKAYKQAMAPPPVQTAPIPAVRYIPKPQVEPVQTAPIPPIKWNTPSTIPEGVSGLSPDLLDGVAQWALNKNYAKATQIEKLQIQRLAAKIGQTK